MAVRVSAESGFDPGYMLKGQSEQAAGERTAGGYYLNAAQEGEPPGRWFGKGAEALGFADGQLVERSRTWRSTAGAPGDGGAAGAGAERVQAVRQIFAAKAGRRAARHLGAADGAGAGGGAGDAAVAGLHRLTVAHNKSVSVLHASFREQAPGPAGRGTAAEALWRAREERVQEILQEANHAALEYLQEQAGFTRTGYHGRRVDGVEPGRWERALLVVTTWLQGTNRDGRAARPLPQRDRARWRDRSRWGVARGGHDGAARQLGAMGAIVDVCVKSALAREFGVTWVRARGRHGPRDRRDCARDEDAFSTRTHVGDANAVALARQWARRYGRAPNAREMLFIGHWRRTGHREAKDDGRSTGSADRRKWDATIGGQLAGHRRAGMSARPAQMPPRRSCTRQAGGRSSRPWPGCRRPTAPGPGRI